MPAVSPGEIWMTDFGMAAKVRPALILTAEPAADELDLVTVLLPVRINRFGDGNPPHIDLRQIRRSHACSFG